MMKNVKTICDNNVFFLASVTKCKRKVIVTLPSLWIENFIISKYSKSIKFLVDVILNFLFLFFNKAIHIL